MKTFFVKCSIILAMVFLLFGPVQLKAQQALQPEKMAWWREAKFGLFIHWGLYAVPAGTWKGQKIPGIGEWIMQAAKIPVGEYATITKDFNPVNFNAAEWVAIAKAAGMKYIVITAKHHDGFAMFKSNASSFNIFDATPFKRDPLKELAAACQQQGLKLGFYYSHAQDWHHPGGAAKGGHWDPAQDGSMDRYLKDVAAPQVKELLTNYGPISVFFWDTPFEMNAERGKLLNDQLQQQPQIIQNDRLLEGHLGDYETPEQFIPSIGLKGLDWEGNMTMNGTWGYKSDDQGWKSTKTIIRNLMEIASKGGNYLLNVGPNGLGEIPAVSVQRLKEVGDWMKINGESIYGSTASPLRRQPIWGRVTRKNDKLYVAVFDWPIEQQITLPMLNAPKAVYLLGNPAAQLKSSATKEGLTIRLPKNDPSEVLTVICIELNEEVKNLIYPPLQQTTNGVLFMPSSMAQVIYAKPATEAHRRGVLLEWKAKVNTTGTYEMILNYDWGPGNNGDEFLFTAGKNTLKGKGGFLKKWAMVQTISFGNIQIEHSGINTFTMKSLLNEGLGLMRIKSVTLKPVLQKQSGG